MDEEPAPRSEIRKKRWQGLRSAVKSTALFVTGILAALLALLAYNLFVPGPHIPTAQEMSETVAQALASATPPPAYSEFVFQVIHPSLVLIQTEDPGKDGEKGHGLGSGVVIDANGDILTSLHVVDGATDILVTFADGTQSSAQVTVKQPENDIAVLLPDELPALLVPATLGNPNAMQVGDEAYVVGNPFGLYGSMSAGVISGFNRTFQSPSSELELRGLIQIDAAVNPGNSGGPLLNRYGEVIGIVEGILNPTEQNVFVGIGFAVPIDIAGGAVGLPPY
jgi:S1-C subfamily serine protease